MENTENQGGSHMFEPVRTPKNLQEIEWLTVDEAVAFCSEHGLSRTPKTLRKWAERSFQKEDAEIIVRREDTMWSYRWKFEKASLLRKVEQEVALAGANTTEPVRTGAHSETDENTGNTTSSVPLHGANSFEPVQTGAEEFGQIDNDKTNEPGSNTTEPVRTGSNPKAEDVLVEVRERLADKDKEIEFLRGQLEKAQAEVERRATSTDDALKTIDRVVRSFELQSEANRALALRDAGGDADGRVQPEATAPIRFTPESVEASTDHDYQQPSRFAG